MKGVIVAIAPRVWWGVWLLYVALWSASLLTPQPITVRNAMIPEDYHFVVTKALHVGAYAVFAALTAFLPSWRRVMLAIVVLHGPLTEYVQQFVGRTGQVIDVGFDWLGVALGVLITWSRWRTDPS
jgi:VanZ family protein